MTALTSAKQSVWKPVFQPEGAESPCSGIDVWTQCTPLSFGMAADATTLGTWRPSGCAIRKRTGDTVGGTTLRQCADAVMSMHGMSVTTYTGPNVITPERLAAYIRAGHKVVVQGGAGAMLGTSQQSTAGDVNHAIEINSVWGGTTVGVPAFAEVNDPAANGRKRSYHVDQGPSTWPWSLVLKFISWLRPNGPGSPRLGSGKVYAGIFPDSEPHVRLYAGARKTKSFPDFTRANKRRVGIYSSPNGAHKYSVDKDTPLYLYQFVNGPSAWGSTLWGGNDDGTEWVPIGAIRYFGGTT